MINLQKKELRKKIKILKSRVSEEEKRAKSKIIFETLEQYERFQQSKTIMAYWSMDDEVHTHEFVNKWYGKKEILLPVVKGDELELRKFTGQANMKAAPSFGIEEPVGEAFINYNAIDIIIVPGVAFDRDKNRLGRGKAYYDKLLKTTRALKIAVCFDFQLVDSVPVDEHDIKMDEIITN